MSGPEYFIGVLSGTSMDGVSCGLVEFDDEQPRLLATHSHALPAPLRESLLTLCDNRSGDLNLFGRTDVETGREFAGAINALLRESGFEAGQVHAVGSHGQTVYHQPAGPVPFTLQIGDPNTVAHLTGISTIADFRRKDMAAGGQGAPLAPVFHQAAFGSPSCQRVILNIGGMANISLLAHGTEPLEGFDTGPGNVLMDAWIQACRGKDYDQEGAWASQGAVQESLLERMLAEPYLALPPPKSTGRELFNRQWLDRQLEGLEKIAAEDVQATLLEFTARSISDAIDNCGRSVREVVVCGGGARNSALIQRLQALQQPTEVYTSDALGLTAEWVEATAFAWFARQAWHGRPVDCRSVTGASRPCLMGGIHYAEP